MCAYVLHYTNETKFAENENAWTRDGPGAEGCRRDDSLENDDVGWGLQRLEEDIRLVRVGAVAVVVAVGHVHALAGDVARDERPRLPDDRHDRGEDAHVEVHIFVSSRSRGRGDPGIELEPSHDPTLGVRRDAVAEVDPDTREIDELVGRPLLVCGDVLDALELALRNLEPHGGQLQEPHVPGGDRADRLPGFFVLLLLRLRVVLPTATDSLLQILVHCVHSPSTQGRCERRSTETLALLPHVSYRNGQDLRL